jgi:hypothetical protein
MGHADFLAFSSITPVDLAKEFEFRLRPVCAFPSLKGHKGHITISHPLTPLCDPPAQSRQLNLIARAGVRSRVSSTVLEFNKYLNVCFTDI